MLNDDTQRSKYIVEGLGFHCRAILDLREVESIKRLAFWGRGYWYDYKKYDGIEGCIHVKENVNVLQLFEELKGGRSF